jgi:hypothetical protein
MKYQLQLVTPPATTVATVAELKDYLRIDNALEDTRISLMLEAATNMLQDELSLKFIEQVWDIYLDYFPMNGRTVWWDGVQDYSIKELSGQAKNITLPLGIGKEFIAFETFDDSNVAIPENVANYIFDSVNNQTRVGLKLGSVWPQTVLRPNNGVKFRIKFGFGAAASAVPGEIRMAVFELVAHMYENRGDQNEMVIPAHILTLVKSWRRMKLENS